ncbi:uncharacterized protein FFB14_06377 [Fusarium fujikuroi]|nr:uncharacterized protein FFB14_06377 [Fusarium fujikuroi]
MFFLSRIEKSFKIVPRLSEIFDQYVLALNGVAKVCHCVVQEPVFRSQGFVLNLDNVYSAFDGFRLGDGIVLWLVPGLSLFRRVIVSDWQLSALERRCVDLCGGKSVPGQ